MGVLDALQPGYVPPRRTRYGTQPAHAELALRDVSVSEAARRIGVSQQVLHNALFGRNRPHPRVVDGLRELLHELDPGGGVPEASSLFTADALARPYAHRRPL